MKITRLTGLLLALVILTSGFVTPVAAAEASPFSDVSPSDWFYPYTLILKERGIIRGYPDGSFRPNQPIIRKHAAKMIALAAGLDLTGPPVSFPDYPGTDEMAPYVTALVRAGAISGFPDGTFRPDVRIKRGHACKMVARAFFGDPPHLLPVRFDDLPDDSEVTGAILHLASLKIVKGWKTAWGNEFRPDHFLTRAQMAKMMCLSMAHAAVRKAERTINQSDAEEALKLVDALPEDQDLDLKTELIQRLLPILNRFKKGLYGNYYWRDVETVNRLITDNDLAWGIWHPGAIHPPVSWMTDWDTSVRPYRMTNLNMSNAGLTGTVSVNALTELYQFSVDDNPGLTGLHVTQCKKLAQINCTSTGLLSLDVSGLDNLCNLFCYKNKDMTTLVLDMSGASSFRVLMCDRCKLSSLDVGDLEYLYILYCHDNKLKTLDLSKNEMMEELICRNNEISSMIFAPATPFTSIDVRYNRLEGVHSIVNGGSLPWDLNPAFKFSPQKSD